ncbi:hypothetical protein P692DRAFT_20872478 [Suillus brevipes Sb2]|nr:hypothetical protein P692DRAFT_20872478 [Suillus brevipes Sb2]
MSSTESSSSSASSPAGSASPVVDRKASPLDSLVEEECNRELNPCNYPLVKSWTRKDWQANTPQSTSARPGSSNKTSRGSGCIAQGINVSCAYIQDEQGNTVTAERAKAIRHWMLSSFRQLEAQDLAPESIGQASLQVLHWLIHTLRKHFIELRFCADNWKTL